MKLIAVKEVKLTWPYKDVVIFPGDRSLFSVSLPVAYFPEIIQIKIKISYFFPEVFQKITSP